MHFVHSDYSLSQHSKYSSTRSRRWWRYSHASCIVSWSPYYRCRYWREDDWNREKVFSIKKIYRSETHCCRCKGLRKQKHTWDLILCDTYIGASLPPFTGNKEFLKNVNNILAPMEFFIVNYLREFEYEKLADMLERKLKGIFKEVKDTQYILIGFSSVCDKIRSCLTS